MLIQIKNIISFKCFNYPLHHLKVISKNGLFLNDFRSKTVYDKKLRSTVANILQKIKKYKE